MTTQLHSGADILYDSNKDTDDSNEAQIEKEPEATTTTSILTTSSSPKHPTIKKSSDLKSTTSVDEPITPKAIATAMTIKPEEEKTTKPEEENTTKPEEEKTDHNSNDKHVEVTQVVISTTVAKVGSTITAGKDEEMLQEPSVIRTSKYLSSSAVVPMAVSTKKFPTCLPLGTGIVRQGVGGE